MPEEAVNFDREVSGALNEKLALLESVNGSLGRRLATHVWHLPERAP